MSKKHNEPTVSRHIELYEADWAFLEEHFGRASSTRLGVSNAIRQMIRKAITDYRARITKRVEAVAAQARTPPTQLASLDHFFSTPKGTPNGE